MASPLNDDRFGGIFHASVTGICISTPHGRFLHANEAYCRMVGYTESELQALDFASLTHPDDLPQNLVMRDEILTGQRENFILEKRYLKKNGDIQWVRQSVSAARTGSGEVTTMIVLTEDIADRKRTDARFRRLVDSSLQGVCFWNLKGEILEANDAFLSLTRYSREDLEAGRINWIALTPPEYADRDRRALDEIAVSGVCSLYEKEYIRADGSRVPILIASAAFEDNPQEGVCFVLDLTEQKKIEYQFWQSQKMESIGNLAGGVAHDFNNILSVMQLQTEFLKMEVESFEDQARAADEILGMISRAAALTRQLLLFSSRQAFQPHDLDLGLSIAETIKMLDRIVGEHVLIQTNLASEPIFVRADPNMLDQILLNLVVNARDAMPDGGDIIIGTSGVEFDQLAVLQSPQARVGSFVCLTVSDRGVGIPPENLSKIFEPFFTTKPVGEGTGLGLSTVFGVVRQHQGWVDVYSEVGQGTTFRIYLPRVAETVSSISSQPVRQAISGGSETVLLVEDDTKLRESVRMALSQLGYAILEAPNGADALEIWKKNRHDIRLLMTDLAMPGGMTGKQLAQRILKENPKLKVIYMSGHSADVVGKDLPMAEGVNFLAKPFQVHKLAQAVRDGLDQD